MNPLKPWDRKGRRFRKVKRKGKRKAARSRAVARPRSHERTGRGLRLGLRAAAVILVAGAGAAVFAAPPPYVGSPAEWLRSERFHLRAIEVLGLETLEAGAVLAHAGLEPGLALIDVDLDRVLDAIREHPRVSESRGARLPPDRLLLEVTERTPAAAIEGERVGVDLEGARFELAAGEADELPVISGAPAHALPLLGAADRAGLVVERIEVTSAEDLRLKLAGSPVWIRVGRDAERSLADWSRLQPSGGIAALGAREVDLRFPGSAILRGTDAGGPATEGGRSQK